MAGTDMETTAYRKRAEQEVLQAAQTDVEFAREAEIAAEGLAAEAPEVLGDGADGAEPAAEALAEDPGGGEKGDQEEHAGGMQGRHLAADQQHLEIHQGGDGEPAFDAGRPSGPQASPAGFVVADEQVELDADPGVEGEKDELHGAAEGLGAVRFGAADQLLADGRRGWSDDGGHLFYL